MQALEALLNRVSVPRLGEPAPTAQQLKTMFEAALRAPDHAQLRPWRFLTIEQQARDQLGHVFAQSVLANNPLADAQILDKARAMPLRAPLLIVVIACVHAHPKVPAQEQLLAAACAAHSLLLAAHAQGLGAVWRTGEFSYDSLVAQSLGLQANESILGFLYVGTPLGALRVPSPLAVDDFVQRWPH